MSQILLFTNNPLNEHLFEKRLRQLGHEVFTTKGLIDRCLMRNANNCFVQVFHHIILSETIANSEVEELIKRLGGYSIPIFRKSDEQLDEEQLEEWKALGLADCIESRPSVEGLREKLSSNNERKPDKVVFLHQSEEKHPLSSMTLSVGELRLFHLLYEQDSQPFSREELCQKMWDKRNTNSSMSQLSVMVKHMRGKLAEQGIRGPIVETQWGRGYRLHDTVYDQIYVDTEDTLIM
ncbi:winged helix-turn-helix domain-containing protein [Enterococcus gilvus]|uniref:winged helix-turn-helix domain-containing protein n=1 Tax=Enterococcus gilvus TaxID=160453 RepID=UPI003D6A8D57